MIETESETDNNFVKSTGTIGKDYNAPRKSIKWKTKSLNLNEKEENVTNNGIERIAKGETQEGNDHHEDRRGEKRGRGKMPARSKRPGPTTYASDLKQCWMSEWSAWSAVLVECGVRKMRRNRQCTTKNRVCKKSECLGNLVEHKDKVLVGQLFEPCCSWTTWGEWSSHSENCGAIRRNRNRACMCESQVSTVPLDCGDGSTHDYQIQKAPCCLWTDWEAWSSSSTTCGKGSIARARICEGSLGKD